MIVSVGKNYDELT